MNIKCVPRLALLFLVLPLSGLAAPLIAGDPIPLPGVSGGFDFIQVDAARHRLLMGHEGNHSFDVFDLSARKLLKTVPTGTSQDAAADIKDHCYYVSGNDPGRLVIVDSDSLTVKGEVPLPAATDLIGFDPETGLVHLCNDTAAQQWVIDPATEKVVTTITFDGRGLEDMALDLNSRRLFQAVKGANTIAEVDLNNNKVLAAWPLAPDKSPHGIALVPDSDGLLVACSDNLVLMDRTNGKILATAPIGGRVDEMAYDPGLHMAYCASRKGEICVVAVGSNKLTPAGNVPDAERTGDIAVDPATHTVWIGYQKGGQCFAQPFTPAN